MCLGAIMWANIDKVYFGCNVNDTDKIGFRDEKFYNTDKKSLDTFLNEVDRGECLKLFSDYAAMDKKESY